MKSKLFLIRYRQRQSGSTAYRPQAGPAPTVQACG